MLITTVVITTNISCRTA